MGLLIGITGINMDDKDVDNLQLLLYRTLKLIHPSVSEVIIELKEPQDYYHIMTHDTDFILSIKVVTDVIGNYAEVLPHNPANVFGEQLSSSLRNLNLTHKVKEFNMTVYDSEKTSIDYQSQFYIPY